MSNPMPKAVPAPPQPPAAAEPPPGPLGAPWTSALRRRASGLLLGHPWFDTAGLAGLKRYFFPLSRLWAAAHDANGSTKSFAALVGDGVRIDDPAALSRALARFEARRATSAALDAAWEQVFFGAGDHPLSYRQSIEAARVAHRHAFNATRRHFLPVLNPTIPPVRHATATPDAVAAIYGPALTELAPYVAPPVKAPAIRVSRAIGGTVGVDNWLRFPSPSSRLGDMVTARVYAPAGVANPPTLIFGHGICVEFDHWQGLVDEVDALVRGGVRVIRPEAPWHGRRAAPAHFGGERTIATFPLGLLDAMTGALQEWAVLAQWARATSTGPLAFGGTSLGALTAQLAADRARDWPEPLRPQALFLITHCGEVGQAIQHGALTDLWGGPQVAMAKGWTEALAAPYLALLDPRRPLVVPSRAIVSVLGRRDRVTPYLSGRALVERWCVPADNAFLLDRGHFSVPMTLLTDEAPVRRFLDVVRSLR